MKAPRDLRKKSDWFRCKKISQKLIYLNFQMRTERKVFFHPILLVSQLCACPIQNFRWRQAKGVSGNQALQAIVGLPGHEIWRKF